MTTPRPRQDGQNVYEVELDPWQDGQVECVTFVSEYMCLFHSDELLRLVEIFSSSVDQDLKHGAGQFVAAAKAV